MRHGPLFLRKRASVAFLFFAWSRPCPAPGDPSFRIQAEESGTWIQEEGIRNEADIRLSLDRSGLEFRLLALQDGPADPLDAPEAVETGFSVQLRHIPTNSKVLYGALEERGLPARVTNPLRKGLPYFENRTATDAQIDSDASADSSGEWYLRLGTPQASPVAAYGAVFDTEALQPSFTAGAAFGLPGKPSLAFDAYYGPAALPPRDADTWFSDYPPLPERDLQFSAASISARMPKLSLAADWALSSPRFQENGAYGNAAIELGDRPFRLSIAADRVWGPFSSREGYESADALRSGIRLDYRWARGGRLRWEAERVSKEDSSLSLEEGCSLLFPRQREIFFIVPLSLAVSASRKLLEDAVSDTAGLEGAFDLFRLRFRAALSLGFETILTDEGSAAPIQPFSGPETALERRSADLSLTFRIGPVSLKGTAAFDAERDSVPAWKASAQAAALFKAGQARIKGELENGGKTWTWTFSWRSGLTVPR